MNEVIEIPATLKLDVDLVRGPADPTPPKKGGATDAAIAVVESAAKLEHLSDPRMAILMGHYEGSTQGGGTYIHRPGTDGPRIGDWLLQPGQTVTPYHFGALDTSWNEDCGEALQKFLDFCATAASREYTVFGTGSFGTSIPLVAEEMNYLYSFRLSIQALAPMDDVLTIRNCDDCKWVGKITIKCGQESWLRRKNVVNGVRIEGGRTAVLCDFEAYGGSGWAVYYAAGNNNMSEIGRIAAQDMGATTQPNHEHLVTATDFSNYGSNNLWQNTTITLSEDSRLPSAAHQMHRAFWISGAGEPYKILRIDREKNTLTVYPKVPDAEQTLDAQHLVYGGGICNYSGGHTAKGRIGHVYPMRCGIGMWLNGQSTANVDGYTGQSNAIDMVMGSDPENVYGGGFVGSVYMESSKVADLIFMSQTSSSENYGSIFGSCSSLHLDRWHRMKYKRERTISTAAGQQDFPITFMYNGELWAPPGGEAKMYDSGRYVASTSSVASYAAQPTRNNTEIYLSHGETAERFKGRQPITFYLYGKKTNGSYPKTVPITCAEGYTINGKPGPLNVSSCDVPITIHAVLESGNNWIVTISKHEMP